MNAAQPLERAGGDGNYRCIRRCLEVIRPEVDTLREGMSIRMRYGYSWWDSILVATALEANCTILYSEDLQDGQVIDAQLRIVNPFR